MAEVTGAYLKQVTNKGGKRWRLTIVVAEPNPDYVTDPREDGQRRKSWGRKPNPDYVEDPREEGQRNPTISRQVTQTLPASVRTKGDAQVALSSWRAEVESSLARKANTGTDEAPTIAEYMDRFNDGLLSTGAVEPATLIGYREHARAIAREWPGARIDEITPRQVEEWRDSMLNGGLSSTTAKKKFNYLRMVFRDAVGKHIIEWSPCAAVKPPRISKRPTVALAPSESRRMVALLDASEPTDLTTGALLAYYAGMRQGETCGLRWRDVDFANYVVSVRSSIGRNLNGFAEKTPKTESSRRDIPAPPQLIEALKRRRDAMRPAWAEARLALGLPTTEKDFGDVFVLGGIDGRPKNPAILSREWASFARQYAITDTAGNRATFHCLRHAYATIQIADGVKPNTLAKRMGHAKPSMTLDVYAAAFEERERAAARDAAEEIGRAFDRVSGGSTAEVVTLQAASNE